MVRVRVRHFNVIEAELKAASDQALRIAIPLRMEGETPALASTAGGALQNSTENRWLGRMVANTLAEISARADLHDNEGALLGDKAAVTGEEVEKLEASKKRKRGELEELRKRVKAECKRVLKEVERECMGTMDGLRPESDNDPAANTEPPAAAKAAAHKSSAVLQQVPALSARAGKGWKRLVAKSEALAGRVESFRGTAAAVSSFLQSKPSRVELAIKQSHRKQQDQQQQQQQQTEEGSSSSSSSGKGKGKGRDTRSKALTTAASGISALAEHVAPAMVRC